MREVAYHWVCDDPPVLRYAAPIDCDRTLAAFVGALPTERVHHLPLYYWHYTPDEVEGFHRRVLSLRPAHAIHHLCNEEAACAALRARGLEASFVHQNAFLDERIFDVDDRAVRRYDAVYTARMSPFKRHRLARDIRRLLLIGGPHGPDNTREYFDALRADLAHATFLHACTDEFLPAPAVAAALNEARVGLCLSAREGGMFAATEYLLCGLPVVTTPSVGGRDVWFEPEFVRTVEPDPAAVRAGVESLLERPPSARAIRERTLARVSLHRHRFIDLVQAIYDAARVGRDFRSELAERRFNKLVRWRRPEDVLRFRTESAAPVQS